MKSYPLPVVRAGASVAQATYVHARSIARADSRFARVFVLASKGNATALNECERVVRALSTLATRNAHGETESAAVLKGNAHARSVGEKLASADGRHVSRNLVPFAVTEANAENINPTKAKGGLNPMHDAAQRAYERKDRGTAANYRAAVRSLAVRVAEKHVRQARMRCEHLRAELTVEIESAVGEFFAVRLARFPRLAADLVARFGADCLPSTTVRALHRCARRAADARMRRMGGKSKLVEPSFFNLFTDESAERSAELDAVFVNARIDYLLGLVRTRGARSGNAKRAADAHAKLLESARTYFLVSIKGEACALPSAGLVPAVSEVGFSVAETRVASAARETAGPVSQRYAPRALPAKGALIIDPRSGVASSGIVATETKGEKLAASALWKRVSRLADFVGADDISAALGRR